MWPEWPGPFAGLRVVRNKEPAESWPASLAWVVIKCYRGATGRGRLHATLLDGCQGALKCVATVLGSLWRQAAVDGQCTAACRLLGTEQVVACISKGIKESIIVALTMSEEVGADAGLPIRLNVRLRCGWAQELVRGTSLSLPLEDAEIRHSSISRRRQTLAHLSGPKSGKVCWGGSWVAHTHLCCFPAQ